MSIPRPPSLIRRLGLGPLLLAAPLLSTGEPQLLWETTGLIAPESVVFDAERQQFYVSNMGTYGADSTPGDGFISRLDADGRLIELRWVTGLEDPKGLALGGGRLYVGDEYDLAVVDPAKGTVVARHRPADGDRGAFNDCTIDPAGQVYVFSSRLRTVFRLSGDTFTPWVQLDLAVTGGINGLRAESDRLLLGGWSRRAPDGSEVLGHLSTVSFADGTVGRIGQQPICHIDGIEPDGRGGYTVSDWLTGELLHVTADGAPTPLLQLPPGAADHHYRVAERLLVVPLMKNHTVRAYRWAPND